MQKALRYPQGKKGCVLKERLTMSDPNKTTAKVGKVKGPKGAVATFIRPNDGVRIWVFTRTGETNEHAITRVKRRNGAADAEHQEVVV